MEEKKCLQHLQFPGGHPSKYTEQARHCLTSRTRQELVYTVWYGRKHQEPYNSEFCVQNMCEHSQCVAHKLKKGCQMWKEDSKTEIMVEEKK